ncbi:DUF397 domain-containing protein [Streptomyces sp. NPDC003077]|uniref:DUF397 domain-containing protein n=1 Tax=Streptomyces sp. NPDC003077 TaxID=3154443 RepID=UPI0033B5FA5F
MSGELMWFKSSYSDDEGGNCLEIAYARRKSSYSDDQGGACLEVSARPGLVPGAVRVRDSKDKAGAQLAFSEAAWGAFISHVSGA